MEPAKTYKLWCVVAPVYSMIGTLLEDEWSAIDKILNVVVTLLLTAIVALHFRFLLKDPKSEPPD